jgi:hydrogenase maturation protein HypF
MAESGIEPGTEIVTVDCDGYGYGLDGSPWGGEVLVGGYEGFRRLGHLEPQPMPGGDLAAYRYGRMLQGVLYDELPEAGLRSFLVENSLEGFNLGEREVDTVFDQIERGINTPMTTSAGRLLDAVSCLLGFAFQRTYEGEGAMKLEAAAVGQVNDVPDLPVEIEERGGIHVFKTSQMVRTLLERRDDVDRRRLAHAFQRALAEGLAMMALRAAADSGLDTVGFTGGVAFNELMTRTIREMVESEGLRFLRHRQVPPGDGGVSLGQAVVAALASS